MPRCNVCGTPLKLGENWWPSYAEKRTYTCKYCIRKRRKRRKTWVQYYERCKSREADGSYICKICGAPLTEENGPPSMRTRFLCSHCRYLMERDRNLEYRRAHYVISRGRLIKGKKRPRPRDDTCELCGAKRHLDYHHYEDEHGNAILTADGYIAGLWLCRRCHNFAEYVDNRYVEAYENLRRRILPRKRPSPV